MFLDSKPVLQTVPECQLQLNFKAGDYRPAYSIDKHENEADFMPYRALDDLPPPVRRLPRHAQEIFRAAFNAGWHSAAGRTVSEQEESAFRIAWAAVKKRYRKVGDFWVEK